MGVDFKNFFRGAARVTRTFKIEFGGFRAQGVPAVLVGVTGIVVAAGIARALSRSSDRLPETLREARELAQALNKNETRRLHA